MNDGSVTTIGGKEGIDPAGSEAAQRASYAEVEGQIALRGGAGSANTVVELVDDKGRIVQSTRTTDQGNYRFKSVDGGQYKVRVKKSGFSDLEQNVQAAPAASSPNSISACRLLPRPEIRMAIFIFAMTYP